MNCQLLYISTKNSISTQYFQDFKNFKLLNNNKTNLKYLHQNQIRTDLLLQILLK